jgi:ubiquinone/menaquinone biosynthesis C-methylase UbiE
MVRDLLHRFRMMAKTFLGLSSSVDRTAVDHVGSLNAHARDQWIIAQLKQIPDGARVLDAGAGEMPYQKYCLHVEYVSQDFAQYDPLRVKEGLQMNAWDYGKLDIVSDVTSIPQPDASFDVVLCTEVIEHIINPMDAMKEFSRLLKPGGKLILTAPFCSMTHFAPYHFYSGYSRFFYQEVLASSGFESVQLFENGNYFEYLAQELKRVDEMGQKYAGLQQSQKVRENIDSVLEYLHACSHKDVGSSELMFFGMHVLAVKASDIEK